MNELSEEEWKDLEWQLHECSDIMWHHSVNMALYAKEGFLKEEPRNKKRADEVYKETFDEVREHSYERMHKIKSYVERLKPQKEIIVKTAEEWI